MTLLIIRSTMSISTKREYKGVLSIKLIAIIASLYGIILNWKGLFSLTYFTNLSNIFMVCVLMWALVKHIKHPRNKATYTSLPHSDNTNALWYTVKFIATLSIMVTFSLYVFFLAPTNEQGFIAAFTHNYCASLCVHVIAPLFALADFLLFDNPSKSNKYTVWCGVIPPFAYIAYVYILSFWFHVTWKHGMPAPYNFLNYAAPSGWFGLEWGAISSTSLGIGVVYFITIFTILFLCLGKLGMIWQNKLYKKRIKRFAADTEDQAHR